MDESCLYSDLHRTLWLNPAIPNHSCDRVHRSTVFFKESEHSVKDERSNFLLVSLLPSILHGSCACKAAMLSRAQGSYKQPKLWALGHIDYGPKWWNVHGLLVAGPSLKSRLSFFFSLSHISRNIRYLNIN